MKQRLSNIVSSWKFRAVLLAALVVLNGYNLVVMVSDPNSSLIVVSLTAVVVGFIGSVAVNTVKMEMDL